MLSSSNRFQSSTVQTLFCIFSFRADCVILFLGLIRCKFIIKMKQSMISFSVKKLFIYLIFYLNWKKKSKYVWKYNSKHFKVCIHLGVFYTSTPFTKQMRTITNALFSLLNLNAICSVWIWRIKWSSAIDSNHVFDWHSRHRCSVTMCRSIVIWNLFESELVSNLLPITKIWAPP